MKKLDAEDKRDMKKGTFSKAEEAKETKSKAPSKASSKSGKGSKR